MRAVTRLFAAVAALALVSATAAQAQHAQTRQGFWIGFGIGFGSLRMSCDGCSSTDRQSSVSGFLKAGGSISDRLLVGGETNGWAKSINGTTITMGSVLLAAYYYPTPASGFFLRGGVGLARYKEAGSNSSSGLGFNLGLGYDLRVGPGYSLTPVANFSFGSVGKAHGSGIDYPSTQENLIQLAVGFTWH